LPENKSMQTREIIALFRASAETHAEATAACLPPALLAACHDGELSDAERVSVDAHLAACDRCLGQLAALSRATPEREAETGVPASLIAQAEALITPHARTAAAPRWRWALPLAAALLLAVNLVLVSSHRPNSEPGSTAAPQTRYPDRNLVRPRLLAPTEGSVIRPGKQLFRWTEAPGALFYDVRLVSVDGDLLLRERVDGTRWLIPENFRLETGEEYFVRVDAFLSDAKYLSSEHVVFRVEKVQ
jgi:hypothetical protein